MKPVNSLGIDCETKGKALIIRRLSALKSTISASDGGVYREDANCSQIHLETTMTEDELEHWLWSSKAMPLHPRHITGEH